MHFHNILFPLAIIEISISITYFICKVLFGRGLKISVIISRICDLTGAACGGRIKHSLQQSAANKSSFYLKLR